MAYRYVNPNAKCPFYRMEEPCTIHCEGLSEGFGLNLDISTREEAKGWKHSHCQDNWMDCFLARVLWMQYDNIEHLKDFSHDKIRNDYIEWMSPEERKHWDEENRP